MNSDLEFIHSTLIVDDDPISVKIATTLSAKFSRIVDVANDGETALKMLTIFKYKLILLDIMMPGINGLETAYRIRQQEIKMKRTPSIIIAITAYANNTNREDCLRAGMNDFFEKPLDFKKLEISARKLLQLQAMKSEEDSSAE
nr:response regulator [Desulfobulbaceae bacterium]